MLHSTTSTLQGKEIREYLGIVTGEAILGANIFRDIFGAIRDIVGGRAAAYEKELSKARLIAMQEMNQKAGEMGAHAIIGIDLDYEVLGKTGSMMMVSVCGTAVKLK